METGFVDLYVDVPAVGDRRFTYAAPEGAILPVGAKVRVPFGRGEADGFVAGPAPRPEGFQAKPVNLIYDPEFMPGDDLLALADEVARYYCAPLASAWSCLWPPVALRRRVSTLTGEPQAGDRAQGRPPGIESKPSLAWGGKEFRWERYLCVIGEAVAGRRGAIVLVPEAKGIEDAAARLESAFPGSVATLHSDQTGVARRSAYLSLIRGDKWIALGTRSAVFAPVRDLGAIVVDDEPSEFYKAPDLPFYDSRTVARMRASLDGCHLTFGSSHPSVDAYWGVTTGRAGVLKEDAQSAKATENDGAPPAVQPVPTTVIDLREARRGRDVLSQDLALRLRDTFSSGGKAILFLNKRGDSSQVTCQDCGNVLLCPRCGVPLGFHSREAALLCHTCGHREEPPDVCPSCGGHRWKFAGIGIERADLDMRRLFPGVPVFRMDRDVSRDRPPAEELSGFAAAQGEACMLATKMLLGFPCVPQVATVGVLSCDTLLNLPDFRAAEKVFHLLWSLRELALPKEAGGAFFVQSYNPEHSGVRGISDAAGFYREQVAERRMLGYPPHRQLVKVRFTGRNMERVRESASLFVQASVTAKAGVNVLGPVPSPKPKARGEHRWQAALRGEDPLLVASACRRGMQVAGVPGVRVTVDVDPVDMA